MSGTHETEPGCRWKQCVFPSRGRPPATRWPWRAPARPNEPGGYLPVNQLPPDRDDAALDPATRAKLEAEMIAARDRQAAASAASTAAPSPNTGSK